MKTLWSYHRDILAIGLGCFFTYVGILHFIKPEWFTAIVPNILPGSDVFWVVVSGIPEVLCGIGLLLPKTRILAAKATVFLLIILYWANLNMWIYDIELNGNTFPLWAHILRGLAQVAMVLIAAYLGEWIYNSKEEEK
ncbi:MAG: hypothetical protein CMB10_04705 [Euryarchaeota archaeon]|nr:hypothetical protein [Euryarchaeota archaeon]RPG76933.1 MAG: hypothetical protein CBC77_006170 [Euryarchaeota archaeon TMED117]|tara:strand:- start:42 stop:455 length:414 start_codon:yes stop_codon:yes gene_type:complete